MIKSLESLPLLTIIFRVKLFALAFDMASNLSNDFGIFGIIGPLELANIHMITVYVERAIVPTHLRGIILDNLYEQSVCFACHSNTRYQGSNYGSVPSREAPQSHSFF